MVLADLSTHVPHVRPHIRRRERKLFFLISNRPLLELAREEVPLYESIDGRKSVAELERMHPGASDRLLRWHEAMIIELMPLITSPARPHLVVIEPHMDDAALSAAGRLLHRRGRCRITILTVVKWSNFTSYLLLKRNFLDVREITELRLQESALAAKLLGAEHRTLDWTDAPLRLVSAESWSATTVEAFSANPWAFTHLFPSRKEVSLIAERLVDHLGLLAPDELWIPMGLGEHVDHRTTRSACLLMLAEARDRFAVPVVMYEDLPAAAVAGHAAQIRGALSGCGTRSVRGTEDITDVFEEKLRVLSIFASQFKLSFVEPRIRQLAEREGSAPGKLAEAYHRLKGERCLPPESQLALDATGLVALETKVRPLLARRTRCRHLTLITLPLTHLRRWKADLVTAFPNADFRVYASEDEAWQAEGGGNDKLRLKVVRKWTWYGVLLRELFHFRTPTLVLCRDAYRTSFKRRVITRLLPFRYVLFAKTLSDFCAVLNGLLGNDPWS